MSIHRTALRTAIARRRTATNWSFILRASDVGTHTLWLEAYDEAGNTTKAGPYTVEVYDNVPPEIAARAPYPGAGNVPLTATVAITFSEGISRTTFAYSVTPDPGGWSETWDTLSEAVTLTHTAFAYGTRYTVTVSAADDLSDNPLTDAPVAWWFETVPEPDTTSPEIVAVSPPDGAMDVPLTAPVVITFSESISTSTFAYSVSPDPDGWAASWDAVGLVVTLTHAPFAEATWYTVTITAADDIAANPLNGAPVDLDILDTRCTRHRAAGDRRGRASKRHGKRAASTQQWSSRSVKLSIHRR